MKRLVYIFVLLGYHFIFCSNDILAQSVGAKMTSEQINLITDRDIYLSGEPIWFSATINFAKEKTMLSKVLFLELFNADKKAIVQKKYHIEEGLAVGQLEIPTEFLSDTYYLRAYTYYNKNFPVETYFLSAIQVINPKLGLNTSIENKTQITNIFEHPEMDNELYPSSKNSYRIKSALSKNGLHIVTIYTPPSVTKATNDLYYLSLINNRLQTISKTKLLINSDSAQVILPNSQLINSGLYYYSLSNESDKILKLKAFIHLVKEPNDLNNASTKKLYNSRQAVYISDDNINNENLSTLSCRVVLKGTVLSPIQKLNQYFCEPILLFNYLKTQFDPSQLKAKQQTSLISTLNRILDQETLMRLYNESTTNRLNQYPDIRDIGLSGIVVNITTQKPIENVPVYLSIFKEHPQIHIYNSRKDGSFFFSLNNFEGEQDVFICPLFEYMDDIELKVNTDFSPKFPKLNSIPLMIDSSQTKFLLQMLIASQTAKAYEIPTKNKETKVGNLPYSFGNPETTVVLDDYVETPSLEIVFKELVPKVHVRKKKGKYNLAIFDSENEIFYNNPLILIDEIPVFDVNELMKVSPKDIEKIELHKTPYILGDHVINGIIMIHTLTNNFGGMIMPKSAAFFDYNTLMPSFKFTAKRYNTNTELKSRSADFRTLLHWEPFIKEENRKKLNFYTSDQKGIYEGYFFGSYKDGQTFHFKAFDFNVID